MSHQSTNRTLPWLANGVAVMWLATGSLHATSISRFARDICEYTLIPCSMAILTAPCLAAIHLVLGGQLLVGVFLKQTLIASIVLLSVYTVASILALVKGLDISCGCLGAFSPRISWMHVVVNLAILGIMTFALFLSNQNKPIACE